MLGKPQELEVPTPVGSVPQIWGYLSKAYPNHLSSRGGCSLAGALHTVMFERFNNNSLKKSSLRRHLLFLQCHHWQNHFSPFSLRPAPSTPPILIYKSAQNQQSLVCKKKIFPGICFLEDLESTGIFHQLNQGRDSVFLSIHV